MRVTAARFLSPQLVVELLERVDLDPAHSIAVLSRALSFDETVAALHGPSDMVTTIAAQTCRDL